MNDAGMNTRILSKRSVSLLGLGGVLLVVLFFAVYSKGAEHVVEIREDSFYPKELTIQKGDTVMFTTSLEKPFWPASNLHPSHTIYSEFDPKEPIEPGKSWSFKFNKAGKWRFHDHLAPLVKSTIIVLDENGEKSLRQAADSCRNLKEEQGQCWQDLIDLTLEEQGVAEAFGVVETLYEVFPNCHDYVHLIGEKAYELFSQDQEIVFIPNTYYCGYGFYHGFMESLLHESGDIEEARRFCIYIDSHLSSQIQGTEDACYHGIGHGAVDGGDPRDWGDIQAMIKPAIDMCEMLGDVEAHRYLCGTGVFNAIEILSGDSKYKLDIIQENPFWLCDRQPEYYREACYTNMVPSLLKIYAYDFFSIAQYIENNIAEQEDSYDIRSIVIMALAHEYLHVNTERTKRGLTGVAFCRKLAQRSHIPCIEGLSGGFMKYGKPGVEYVEGLAFCKSEMLFEEEQEACFRHILLRLTFWNSPEESREICKMVENKFQHYCSNF